ncbi:hypothetical protein LCGC14_1153410 [marine sediment metagenome]|uniref:N-acetyltransferase domain-containing protein n=1 Tax=marine sediment metagenome TaxID=412755 RepID=A0A0F9Q0C6_9ZZZZ
MANVVLKRVSPENRDECLALSVADSQQGLVASNAKSLGEAEGNATFHPYAVYEARAPHQDEPRMVGFTMYEVLNGIGFITRIMIDERYQRQGFGRAATAEVIQRLRQDPAVETIATSHLRHNDLAARLFAGLGFREWRPEWASDMPHERVLRLPEGDADPGASSDADQPRR